MPSQTTDRAAATKCRECQLGIFCYDHTTEPIETDEYLPEQQSSPQSMTPKQAADNVEIRPCTGSSNSDITQRLASTTCVPPDTERVEIQLPRIMVNGKEIPLSTADFDPIWYGGGAVIREDHMLHGTQTGVERGL